MECASHTALRSRDAVTLGVPIKCRREEYVSHMALRRSNAALKDVRSKLKREEFVTDIVQKVSLRLTTHRKKQSLSFLPIIKMRRN